MPSVLVTNLFQRTALTRYLLFFNFSTSPSFVLPVQQASRGSYKMNSPYYTCVWPCKASWDQPGPFNRHQRTCKHWLVHEEKMQKRQREATARPKKRVNFALNKVPFSLVICLDNWSDYSIGNKWTACGANPNGRWGEYPHARGISWAAFGFTPTWYGKCGNGVHRTC